jgi:hypothetical protein
MASPFPGMDPYLEHAKLWPEFQRGFLACCVEALQPSLGDRYRLRVAAREYDHQQVLLVSIVKDHHREEYLEIRQRGGDKLITHVDLVNPANRTTAEGRAAYVATRNAARQAAAHTVELDLVVQGHSCLDVAAEGLPDFDYAITVGRSKQADRFEMYTTTVQKKLPKIRLPLAADDRDLVVDIQGLFSRCYDRFFAGKIDYKKDPPVLLRDADLRWANQLLKQQGLR